MKTQRVISADDLTA